MAPQPGGLVVHACVITAKPGRIRRTLGAIGRWVPRVLIGCGLAVLGVLVFALRSIRAIANLVAYTAARVEFWAADRTGRTPVGQTIGVGVADAFAAEFHRGWANQPAA